MAARGEPTSSTAPKWGVVGLTRLRAEPEIWTPDTQSANAIVGNDHPCISDKVAPPLEQG